MESSQLWRLEIQPQGTNMVKFWGETSSALHIHPYVHPHLVATGEKGSKLSHEFCKGTNPVAGLCIFTALSNPNYFQKLHFLIPAHCGVGLQHTNLRRHIHSATDNSFPFSFVLDFFASTSKAGCHWDLCLGLFSSPLFTSLMASSMLTALISTFRFLIPTFTSSALAHTSNPLFFQMFSGKIHVNDLTPQILCVSNWTWHLFMCPNGSLN